MFSNKVGIKIEPQTRLGAVATAFKGERSAQAFLRYKDGVLYTKPLSKTAFLAALGHKPSREKIKTQAADAMKALACMVDARWGEGTAARIGLDTFGLQADGSVRVLSGRSVADLNTHAIAADALQTLGCMKNASVADRDAALQTIKGYMNEALDVDPDIGKAARQGVFRYALLQHLRSLERGGAVKHLLPRNLEESAKLTTEGLAKSVRYQALDTNALALAQRAYSAQGRCSPEVMRVLEIEAQLAQGSAAQAQGLMRTEFKAVIEAITALPNAFRDNSAIGKVMSARAHTADMNAAIARTIDGLLSDTHLQAAIPQLDKYSETYKNDCAALVQPALSALLQQMPPESLSLAYCQDVQMGLEVIGGAALQNGIDPEALKETWLINALGLRLLTPAITTRISNPNEAINRDVAKGIAAGLQKVINDPALNGEYLAYMRAVAERGHTAAPAA